MMGPSRSTWLTWALAAVLALPACRGTREVEVASAADLAAADTAVVRCLPGIAIDRVDGDPTYRVVSTATRPVTLRLPPGVHVLAVRLDRRSATDEVLFQRFYRDDSEAIEVDLRARAGAAYVLDFAVDGRRWRPRLRYADGSDDPNGS